VHTCILVAIKKNFIVLKSREGHLLVDVIGRRLLTAEISSNLFFSYSSFLMNECFIHFLLSVLPFNVCSDSNIQLIQNNRIHATISTIDLNRLSLIYFDDT
jgi:hypothetical protein